MHLMIERLRHIEKCPINLTFIGFFLLPPQSIMRKSFKLLYSFDYKGCGAELGRPTQENMMPWDVGIRYGMLFWDW